MSTVALEEAQAHVPQLIESTATPTVQSHKLLA